MLCTLVFLTAFFYRFNTLGGALGGFSNDEFGYLARARQIQAGDVPFRDFNDPGWFLTDYLAAAAQWLGGYNLRSEALLTVGMLSVAAVLTFLLARRAAGSYAAALAATAIQIVLEPRHYNYPKLVLYAAAIALAWAYVDKPSRGRLAGLGAITGVGFLFRHDHILYLGMFTVLTVAIVHRATIREAVRASAAAGAVAACFVVPFLAFTALNGGVGEYFRSALVYIRRDAQRTSFSFPQFSYETQLDGVPNATAFLYYTFLALPPVMALVLVRARRTTASAGPMLSLPHLVPVIVLGAVLTVGFLSRGSTNIRIPDVGVTSAIFLAWLLAIVFGRGAHLLSQSGPARLALRAAVVTVLAVTVLSVNGLARVSDNLRKAGFTGGPLRMIEQASIVGQALSASPAVYTEDEEQPRLLRLAGYVRACTAPGDRLFVLGHYPELYYFSDRPFAGGHVWLLPRYYSEDEDEALMVARLKRARVPVVVTENRATYDSEYRNLFEQVDRYLVSEYRDAGDVDVGSTAPLRVLIRKDLRPAGQYEPLGLPCFTSPGARAAR